MKCYDCHLIVSKAWVIELNSSTEWDIHRVLVCQDCYDKRKKQSDATTS